MGFYSGFEYGLDKRPLRENIVIVEETDQEIILKNCGQYTAPFATSTACMRPCPVEKCEPVEIPIYYPKPYYSPECEEDTQQLEEEFKLIKDLNKQLFIDLATTTQAIKELNHSIKEKIFCN